MLQIRSQSGIALTLFLIIFVLGAAALLLSDLNNSSTKFRLEDQAQTALALAQAKEALLGFAMTYAKTHPGQPQGYLLCPDNDGDGTADPPCSTKGNSVIGRFPWRTLGLPPLRDGSGECLWYAVSGTYKDNPKDIDNLLTSDSDGLFIVKNVKDQLIAGATDIDRAIAIIFAPGKALEVQNRGVTSGMETECGSTENGTASFDEVNDVNNYLDNYSYNSVTLNNGTGNDTLSFVESGSSGFFATTNPSDTPTFINAPFTRQNGIGKVIFNDTLMLITPKDFEPVYTQMDLWVAQQAGQCLINYSVDNRETFLDKYKVAIGDLSALSSEEMAQLVGGTLDILPDGTYRRVYQERINSYVKMREARFLAKFHETHNVGEEPSTSEIKAERTDAMINAIQVQVKFPWAAPIEEVLTYTAESGLRFGRIPEAPESTNDHMAQTWNNAQISGETCFYETSGYNDYEWRWWKKWKEMVFYAVDEDYNPGTATYMWVKAIQTRSLVHDEWLDWVAWIAAPFDEITSDDWDKIDEVTGNDLTSIKQETLAKITEPYSVLETDWEHDDNWSLPKPILQLGSLVGNHPEGFNPAKFIVLVAGRRLLLNKGNIDLLSEYPQVLQSRVGNDRTFLTNYLEGQAKPLDPLDTERNDPEPALEKWRRLDQGGNLPETGKNDRIDSTHPGDEIFIRKPIIPGYFNDVACKNGAKLDKPPDCQIPK